MEESFWADRMRRHGVEILVPGPKDREIVHRVIYDELCLGVFSEASRAKFLEIIERPAAAGAGGVILGGTEIELLVRPDDTSVPRLSFNCPPRPKCSRRRFARLKGLRGRLSLRQAEGTSPARPNPTRGARTAEQGAQLKPHPLLISTQLAQDLSCHTLAFPDDP